MKHLLIPAILALAACQSTAPARTLADTGFYKPGATVADLDRDMDWCRYHVAKESGRRASHNMLKACLYHEKGWQAG